MGKPSLGASRLAHPGSWRGGRTEPVPQAFLRRTSPWPDRRRHLRALGSSARISDRGAEPKGTPDRSKLFGSHGQRPWLHDVVSRGEQGGGRARAWSKGRRSIWKEAVAGGSLSRSGLLSPARSTRRGGRNCGIYAPDGCLVRQAGLNNVGINRPTACRRSELNERLGDSGLNQLPCHPPAANGKHLADEAIRGIAAEKRRE